MATHTVPTRTNTVRYNLPDRRSPRGSMLGSPGSPEEGRAPSEHVPGGFDDNPQVEDSESGPVVSYGELMREMAPKLSNTSRGKGKRTVTAVVPRIGTTSHVPSSDNMNENRPQTGSVRPRVSNPYSSNQDANEILPSESASQVGHLEEEPNQGIDRGQSTVSMTSSIARAHQYQDTLRLRVALEMLRRDDIMKNNTSIIPEQGIEVEDVMPWLQPDLPQYQLSPPIDLHTSQIPPCTSLTITIPLSYLPKHPDAHQYAYNTLLMASPFNLAPGDLPSLAHPFSGAYTLETQLHIRPTRSYIDVLASTTPTTQYRTVPHPSLTSLRLRDPPGPPRKPSKGHHLAVLATTRSFPSSVTVLVAPFELQPAPSMLQHKPSHTKTYPKTYFDPGLTEDDFGYDTAHPNIRINWKKITETELQRYRKKYPEIGRKQSHSNRPGPSNSRSGPQQTNYQASQHRQGAGGTREQGNVNARPRNTPSPNGRNLSRDQSPPPPDPTHFRSGANRGVGAGGGPPGDPPPPGSGSSRDDHGSDDDSTRNHLQHSHGPNGPQRYGSEDPNASIEEKFEYDPTPRSEEEVLRASFQRYEQLIMFYLYGPPLNQNSAAQKAILQNIPKPGKWGGSSDYMEFEEWFMELIQWMNIADQCGPPTRFSETRGGYVLTAVDLTRTNTIGSFREGKALRWFRDEVQKVVNGLYQRFIHEASIAQVSDKFYEVTYSRKDGVKVMFSELKRWAACMPVPPDLYTFKKRVLLLVPQAMCNDMTRIEKVSAERSSVNEIMQSAISCERSDRTGKYYANAQNVNEQSQRSMRSAHKESTLPYSEDSEDKGKVKEHYKGQERSRSPKRLQVIDKRRYSVNDHNQIRHEHGQHKKDTKPMRSEDAPFTKPKQGACFDCGSLEHYRGSPQCKRAQTPPSQNPQRPKLYRIAEETQKGGEQLFRLEETTEAQEESPDEGIWVRYENSELGTPDGEPDPWGGSQYESDAADDDYLPSEDHQQHSSNDESTNDEHMHHMRDWDSFTVHWRDQLGERFGALIDQEDNQSSTEGYETAPEDAPQNNNDPTTTTAY
ncbi:hypothetical protein C8R41DRAFT_913492 [Lentinula lateritia]|uniref:Uncharacterized protein n=1 Tax=Lentinula lateritia TaxID=40482 RepID=A0ABQ8VZP4_9AGAR|nr:hypothetical protein C8R41DRAFT_913492 [Lentinula lateritia]